MKRLRLGGIAASALSIALVLFVQPLQGYPTYLACNRSITAGSPIMGASVLQSSTDPRIRLAKDGVTIECGGSLRAGDAGLNFSWGIGDSQLMNGMYLIETVASVGSNSIHGIQGGSCGMQRAIGGQGVDAIAKKYTVPSSGVVTVRAAYAMQYGQVTVTQDCVYHVTSSSQCAPGYTGSACDTSLCAATLVPGAFWNASSGQSVGYVCVPEALKPHPDVSNCTVEETWDEILRANQASASSGVRKRFRMGGLGKFMVIGEFEVWFCDAFAPCRPGLQGGVCFIYSEREQEFIPWGTYQRVMMKKNTSSSTPTPTTPPPTTTPSPSSAGVLANVSMTLVKTYNTSAACWVVVHGLVIDVTDFRDKHPGGPDKYVCGTDLTTKFEMQHGSMTNLKMKLQTYSADLRVIGLLQQEVTTPEVSTQPAVSGDKVEFDFSSTTKTAHPGSGSEFETLVYIELQGGLDGAAAVVNVGNQDELDLWCSKRPTLAAEYCECLATSAGVCTQWGIKDGSGSATGRRSLEQKMFRLPHTDGHLAMTDMLAGGDTGWKALWDSGKMAVVPGVGRDDHGRSHFEVKDAAAKGVSVEKEGETFNGWLAKSIFGYNNLYCRPNETVCPPPRTFGPPVVDGISLAAAAAGPNALEASHSIANEPTFNHMSGVQNVDGILNSMGYQFNNPFTEDMMIEGDASMGTGTRAANRPQGANAVGRALARRRSNQRRRWRSEEEARNAHKRLRMTEDEMWAQRQMNLGLQELLRKEETIFQGLGVMKDKLAEYKQNLATLCPVTATSTGFPDVSEWADSESSAEIGMQLRAVAILIVNGVSPKVFQAQQTGFDTHSNQGDRLKALLTDLRTAVFTFVKAAEACGFWRKVVVTTFSDFGRRLEENSRKGTDHGWGSYMFVFGDGLRQQVLGYNPERQSAAIADIVPFHADAYSEKEAKGDLMMTTRLESWNACLLQAMALPSLPRLGKCPHELRIRDNLTEVPEFNEQLYYKSSSSDGSGGSASAGGAGDASSITGNTSHLTEPMTPAEVLHFARRTAYSTRTLGLDNYSMPDMSKVLAADMLRCAPGTAGVEAVANPPLEQRTFSADPVRTSSELNQTSLGGAYIPKSGETAPFLEMDLGRVMTVNGVLTQGRGASYCSTIGPRGIATCNSWVKTAKIEYRAAAEDAATQLPQTFVCNVIGDVEDTATVRFPEPVQARFVRILPVDCQSGCGLRAAVLVSCTEPNITVARPGPVITLQQAIALVLSADNIQYGASVPYKPFTNYQNRVHYAFRLWTQERRERRNNFKDLTRLPYPMNDPIQRRAKRWGIEECFNWSSLVINPDNEMDASIQLAPEWVGKEGEILKTIEHNATLFFYPYPAQNGELKHQLLRTFDCALEEGADDSSCQKELKPDSAPLIDWYHTVMQNADVKMLVSLTPQMIVDDRKCTPEGTHPDDPSVTCDPKCDLRSHLAIDFEAETAYLIDTNVRPVLEGGGLGHWQTSSFYTLMQCVTSPSHVRAFATIQKNQVNGILRGELLTQYALDVMDPRKGLRARMTWFFLNFYATPKVIVNDNLLMWKQYKVIWEGSLGNYRRLALQMFNDEALRKSLDQLQEVECGTAPIENFAREWFERFTVGLKGHNEGDVKQLAKGLMNCKDYAGTFNEDLVTPGIIFTDVNESLWTLTEEEQTLVVDRILDFTKVPSEPPVAAQFLCAKLYGEFGKLPPVPHGACTSRPKP
jgi:uncharacterized protein (DUF1501 family)